MESWQVYGKFPSVSLAQLARSRTLAYIQIGVWISQNNGTKHSLDSTFIGWSSSSNDNRIYVESTWHFSQCNSAAATRGTFLLVLATQLFFMLQGLWNQNVTRVARGRFCTTRSPGQCCRIFIEFNFFATMMQILGTPGHTCNNVWLLLQNSFEDVELLVRA